MGLDYRFEVLALGIIGLKAESIFCIKKVGSDGNVGVLCNVKFLEDHGVKIPAKARAEKKKK